SGRLSGRAFRPARRAASRGGPPAVEPRQPSAGQANRPTAACQTSRRGIPPWPSCTKTVSADLGSRRPADEKRPQKEADGTPVGREEGGPVPDRQGPE